MTQTSREELVVVRNLLEKKINDLEHKVNLLPDPFSKLSMLQVHKGGTGASIIRRIPLYSDVTAEVPVTAPSVGNLNLMSRHDLVNANTDIIYYQGVIIPTDYIATGTVTFNYMYSSDDATDTINWVITVKSITDEATSEVALLSDTTSVAAPGTIDTLDVRSVALTTLPKIDTVLYSALQRTTGDANTGNVSVWATWLEYVAFI